jgi:deazaflavin-dependent oxidoreductase (nitroreductase family)
MTEAQDWDQKVIEEFRANSGNVGREFAGSRLLLLLHSKGAKSGQERVNPLVYLPVDGGHAVFASKGGAPTNPDWYYNIMANPDVTIEVGTETMPARARVVEGEERERIWTEQKRRAAGFADYEKATNRTIPVVILQPQA